MNNNETCVHGGTSPKTLLKSLHKNQGKPGRHKCPICAYEQGYFLGISKRWSSYTEFCNSGIESNKCKNGSIAPITILVDLNKYQGGTGRHKCSNCAFKQGFEEGCLGVNAGDVTLDLVSPPNITLSNRPAVVVTIDYAKREAENRELGYVGEIFILKVEMEYLKKNGKPDLASRVRHLSAEEGDGFGYDILSFDLDGNEKRIEVKTTRGSIARPFYISRNEVEVSSEFPNSYYLYRLFDFDSVENKGQYYVIKGNLRESLKLDSILYLAAPNSQN